jgi:hypothetical protein
MFVDYLNSPVFLEEVNVASRPTFDIQLSEEGATVSGRGSDVSGAPVPAAIVSAMGLENLAYRVTTTDAHGDYFLPRLPNGTVTIRANAPAGRYPIT